MTRPPFVYGYGRGQDGDGGAADLQTDVMRFMAILSLCLVAIFALVQSIPPVPQPAPAVPEPIPVAASDPTIETAAPPVAVATPSPRPEPVREPVRLRPEAPSKPAAPAKKAPAARTDEPAPLVQSPPAEGFTLSFESDAALSRLVARHEVGLYALVAGEKALRMSMEGGRPSFWDASTPARYHEMDAATVPDEVAAALRRNGKRTSNDVVWAVTLPSQMSRDLDRYLRDYAGGSLIIGADGRLRREG